MTIHAIIAAPALALLALNLKATHALKRAAGYERKQKIIQFFLVWLFPVAGGILVWSMAASEPSATEAQSPRQGDSAFSRCDNEYGSSWDSASGGGGSGY